MAHLACSVSPTGNHRFLRRGNLTPLDQATRYAYPGQAWKAIERFLYADGVDPRDWRFDVIDTRTRKSVYGLADHVLDELQQRERAGLVKSSLIFR